MRVLQQETKNFTQKVISSRTLKVISRNMVCFLVAMLASRGRMFSDYLPYGIAFLAAIPYDLMWTSLLGCIISYILPSEINIGMRYISTAIAVCAIRWALNDLKKLKEHVLFSPMIAFATTIVTGIAANRSDLTDINLIYAYITEAMFAAVAAYFFKETIDTIEKKGRLNLNQIELAYLCFSFFVVTLTLSELTIGYLSVGRIINMLVILFCSRYLGVIGGSIAGVAAATVLGLSFKNPTYIPIAYTFGGLLSGLFSGFGKSICTAGFFLVNIIVVVQSDNPVIILTCIYESLAASIIFMFLPDYWGSIFLNAFYYPYDSNARSSYLKDAITMKLNFASGALMNISTAINRVTAKLTEMNKQDITSVYSKSIGSVCNSCGLRVFCYEAKKDDTISSFEHVTNVLKSSGELEVKNFKKDFVKRCCKIDELSKAINLYYKDYVIQSIAKQRIDEVRGFISEQFADIGRILYDISKEFETYDTFDEDSAQRIIVMLKRYGIVPIDVSCRVNKFDRMTVEIDIIGKEKRQIEKIPLQREASKCCARAMDLPVITVAQEKSKIMICEQATFKVKVGVAQHVYKNGSLCGDSYKYFNDGMGRMEFVLSDGMGTGGRAAIEGSMACEIIRMLIQSGISFETAARLTNSALIVKSEEEFLSTLDVLCIDLFTGKVDFLKAGAPFTLVKIKDEIKKIDLPSLPIGILKDIEFKTSSERLGNHDKVLMFSDGALYKEDWIFEELGSWNDEDSQMFAEKIVDRATKLRENESDDDITVIAIHLVEK